MRKKSFNRLFMSALLLGGYLCTQAPLQAQQMEIQNEDLLDLNFKKVDPETYNGSSYTIDGAMFRNMPVTHIANVLTGIMPGFFTRQISGSAINEAPDYWIRGRRTTSEGILVLVDGQERAFGSLSTYEIDKITILKDAAAVALYGMRAANGAILVTTRRGETGKPKIEFTAQLASQQPLRVPKPLNASDYTRLYNEAYMNDNPLGVAPYADPSLYTNSANPELYPNMDWLGKYYDTEQLMQKYNLNVSGGTSRTRYFVNFGAMMHEGMYNTDKATTYSTDNEISRYNIRSNFQVDVTPTTLLTADVYGWVENQNRPNNSSINAFTSMLQTPAHVFPAYYADNGKYKDLLGQSVIGVNGKIIAGNSKFANPWPQINRAGYGNYNEIYGSFRVKLDQDLAFILPGLKVSGDISMDSQMSWVINRTKGFAYYEYMNDSTLRKTGTDGTMTNGVASKSSNRRITINGQLSYQKQFGEHNVSAFVGYNQYESADEVSIPVRMQGLNSWIGYNYNKRYGIDLIASYYGSYKFAKGKRFGFFPSVAASWTISNEDFFENSKELFPYLRLRGSIGQVGSDRGIAAHQYLSALSQTAGVYNFGNTMAGVGGYVLSQIANENVTWEKALIYNVGLEGRMFNDKLSFVAEYFRDQRSDIYLTNERIGALYGVSATIKQNVGTMYSQGIDASFQWSDKIGDVTYNIGGNYSLSRNMVQDFAEAEKEHPWLYSKGYPVGLYNGLTVVGFFAPEDFDVNGNFVDPAMPVHTFGAVQAGDIRYKDLNSDGLIDALDMQPMGSGNTPNQIFALNLGAEYKGLGFTVMFQGATGIARNIATDGYFALPFYSEGNMFEHQLNYWTPSTAATAEYPRLSVNNASGTNNIRNSDMWIRDADYIRLKTAQIYYNLPESLFSSKTVLKGVQVYFSGYNLVTWDKLKIMDPEWDQTTFPITRNVSIGCTIKI
jgi:TonB-linked SusC/RagA family outer membrane protein